MNEIIEVQQGEMLQALNRSEIDIQIATAKRYPRDINKALSLIERYATMDNETAMSCFYKLHRGNSDIEGVSVRLAEIIASCWGNLRVQTRIIGNDGKTITAQGICHDLETNLATSVEVKRRITDKFGRTFSEDMQVVTGNAASAIAYRNAVLKVVPKAITKTIINKVREAAMRQPVDDMEGCRNRMVAAFAQMGVTEDMLLRYLEIDHIEAVDKQMLFDLKATMNAIKEGTTTVEETFIKPMQENNEAQKAKAKAEETKQRVSAAQKRNANLKTVNGKNK